MLEVIGGLIFVEATESPDGIEMEAETYWEWFVGRGSGSWECAQRGRQPAVEPRRETWRLCECGVVDLPKEALLGIGKWRLDR
jgi:hypothetical protein